MVKYEAHIQGDFDELLNKLHEELVYWLTAKSEYHSGNFRCAMRLYEDQSMLRGDSVHLSIMLVENENELFVSVISSAGDVWWQKKRLEKTVKIIEEYKNAYASSNP